MTLTCNVGVARSLQSLQGLALGGAIRLLQCLEPTMCSHFGAILARTIGPTLAVSRVALNNLKIAFPEMAESRRHAIMRDAWDNLGRLVAEFPHLPNLVRTQDGPGWEIVGEEFIEQAWRKGNPPLFFSAHLGNWEMILPIAGALGLPVGGVYRRTKNPVVDWLIQDIRKRASRGRKMFPKGRQGARAIIAHLSTGGTVGFLVDQKMNDGIKIPFFGRPAWTAPAIAHLALRFDRNIVPVRVVRTGPARFRLICEPALQINLSNDQREDEISIMSAINRHVEGWIRSYPSSWLWFHRRWPKDGA
ncbi:lysophospholipid acyltransferase family protein [Gluconacetobacter aggeris]